MKPAKDPVSCLSMMREAPWGEICFGDDPLPLLILLMVASIVLYPLMREAWLVLLLLLLLAVPRHAWIWGRQLAPDTASGARNHDGTGPP